MNDGIAIVADELPLTDDKIKETAN